MNMRVSDNNGAADGILIAANIQELMHEVSAGLAKDDRETQRHARSVELKEGLEAARLMHEKADAVATSALVGGSLTMVCAVGQFDAAGEFGDVSDHQANADVKKWEAASAIPGNVTKVIAAEGDRAEARSLGAQARSKAAQHQADEAESDLQALHKLDDSANEVYQEIERTQHASMMAVLARQ
jgi:hypothetical protein